MNKCIEVIVNSAGEVTKIISEVSCEPTVINPWFWYVVLGVVVFIGLPVIWSLALAPLWRVWAQRKEGEAALEQAYKEQKIQIAQAESRKDAASLNKQAAIIEAEAVSEQIKRIGNQLTEHDLYLKWQWIEMMEKQPNNSVIYVPTEASLPILEAGKRKGGKSISEEEIPEK